MSATNPLLRLGAGGRSDERSAPIGRTMPALNCFVCGMGTERGELIGSGPGDMCHSGCLSVSPFDDDLPALQGFDEIIVSSSGGKDSMAALLKVVMDAERQGVPLGRITVVHADLGERSGRGQKS
jgi:hypothetical protein